MAINVVQERGLPIRIACLAFRISESCYRYERKTNAENEEIANWLLRLTDNHRNWGFGLCYLYLRNVKGFGWNCLEALPIFKNLFRKKSDQFSVLIKNQAKTLFTR
jgi:putative transposase